MRYGYDSGENKAYSSVLQHGGVKALVSFSGGNDEGGVDTIQVLDKNDEVVKEFDYDDMEGYDYDTGEDKPIDPICEYGTGLVEGRYGGFGGETSARGTITIDALARKTSWKVSESHAVEHSWES